MALEPAKIVAAALTLLDETGLDGLTMRRLADVLGVQAASLYWHFPGKPALLDGMADALLTGIGARIDRSGDHAATVRSAANALRQALLARRDGARVYSGTFVVGENVLAFADGLVGGLLSAGFDAETSARFSFTTLYFVLGFVIEEQALQSRPEGTDLATLAARLDQAASQRFPSLGAILPELMTIDQDARFAFGIDLLTRGLGQPRD